MAQFLRMALQVVAESQPPDPMGLVPKDDMKVVCDRISAHEEVTAGETVFSLVLIAGGFKSLHQTGQTRPWPDSNGDVDDRFCRKAWDGRAADMFDTARVATQITAQASALVAE